MSGMDDIAHALVGTLIARSHPSRAKGLALACVLGALIPDADIVATLWGRDYYLTIHRGFTHSLLGLVPMSLLAAGMAWLAMRRRSGQASPGALWGMAFVGVASHDFLDWCTSWGTMLLWPNRTRFALDHLFIIDLWYWALLIIPLFISALIKGKRHLVCALGLVGVFSYHALAAFNHQRALSLAQGDQPQTASLAFPEPFSPFRWSAFNRGGGLLKNARIDFLKSGKPLEWRQWDEPPVTPQVRAAMDSPEGRQYLWFARVPLWEEEKQKDGSTVVDFWDLRFQNRFGKGGGERRFGARIVVKDGKAAGKI